MKVLVFGSNGFIGSNTTRHLIDKGFDVYPASREGSSGFKSVDLTDKESVMSIIEKFKPDYIINCAGVVENSEKANLNSTFTRNILEVVTESKVKPKRVVICGSAAIYGFLEETDLPVSEDTSTGEPLSVYGKAKLQEETTALNLAESNGLSIVVARIFNPLGPHMHARFLTSNIVRQIHEIESGERENIEVSRLDSKRDYIDVIDLSKALYALLVAPKLLHNVYNIGSGKPTTNKTIIDLILNEFNLKNVKVTETSDTPERTVAYQADITRISNDTKWTPKINIDETIKRIV